MKLKELIDELSLCLKDNPNIDVRVSSRPARYDFEQEIEVSKVEYIQITRIYQMRPTDVNRIHRNTKRDDKLAEGRTEKTS
jgi:hypothetical protein